MEELNNKLNLYKVPIGLSFVGLVLLIGGMFSSGIFTANSKSLPPASKNPADYPPESVVKTTREIKVDIAGEVNKPGVYTLQSEARIEDVVKKAEGFTLNANKDFLAKSLNLSQKVVDGQKIYIPKTGEVAGIMSAPGIMPTSEQTQSGKIGINTASASELDTLSGVGPVTSQKIIEKRPYQELNELVIKKAVSRSVYEKIKDQIDLH